MTTDKLMQLSAEKALKELDWDSIEYLFKPRNMGALLLRLDFGGFKNKVLEALMDDSPTAMPHRFRGQYWPAWNRAFELEEFYLKLKAEKDKQMKVFEVITEHTQGMAPEVIKTVLYATCSDDKLSSVAAHYAQHCYEYKKQLLGVREVLTIVERIEVGDPDNT